MNDWPAKFFFNWLLFSLSIFLSALKGFLFFLGKSSAVDWPHLAFEKRRHILYLHGLSRPEIRWLCIIIIKFKVHTFVCLVGLTMRRSGLSRDSALAARDAISRCN